MKLLNDQCSLSIATPDGEFIAHYSPRGLAGLDFPTQQRSASNSATASDASPQVRRWHAATVAALKRALAGRAPGELPPLDLSVGTDFQQAVWKAMRGVAAGETTSYGQIARTIRKPKAVRAVGGACGANPIPVFVPCHRVLASNRKLGGFSGGVDWKRRLLKREGVPLADS